jgi:hypothetical protein
MKNIKTIALSAWLASTLGGACFAAILPQQGAQEFEPARWQAVTDDQLATMRGGFDLGSGLRVSFGIVRTVFVNGQMVNSTSFNFADLANISAEESRLAKAEAAKATVVTQYGENNYAGAGIRTLATGGTVIQNTLDNQNIQFSTVINTGVNNLSLLKSANTQIVLRDALLGSIGVR